MKTFKDIYVVGDSHGNFRPIQHAIENFEISKSLFIHVGDFGIGFGKEDRIESLNQTLAESGNSLISIRGNHDDPSAFPSDLASNITLIKDGTIMQINGLTWMFAGGAVSVDRRTRISRDAMAAQYEGGIKKTWWEDETFNLERSLSAYDGQEIDVLILHSAPPWGAPFGFKNIQYWIAKDDDLVEDLLNEQNKISKLVETVQPKQIFCGHFHTSFHATNDNIKCRILDIDEILLYENKRQN